MLSILLTGLTGSLTALADTVGEDGLHKQPWFSITFKDVAEDIEEASQSGKRLAMVFEQRGCIYCKKMHEVFLADPEISEYIQTHFQVVQYNLFGDEEVTDLDGEVLSEKDAAKKWDVMFTPTILFMDDTVVESESVAAAAVARMPGAFDKKTFLHAFEWVNDKGYETDQAFQSYHAERLKASD